MAESGCLVSCGIRISDACTIAGALTNEMSKGAPAGDTLAGQPTQFELVINMKTAKTLGLAVPPLLLATADAVIE